VARIFVPRAKHIAATREDHQDAGSADTRSGLTPKVEAQERADQERTGEEAKEKSAEEAMAKVAADLRGRAVNGEDPDKLQMEAYTEPDFPEPPPTRRWKRCAETHFLRNMRRS